MDVNSGIETDLLLNLTAETYTKKSNHKKTPEIKENVCAFSTKKKKLHLRKKQSGTDPYKKQKGENDITEPKSKFETLPSSSLFKSNPEIPPLSVIKRKGPSEPLFSKKTFGDLNLHPHLVSCLKSRLEIVRLTKVQEKTIPVLLDNRDALVKSCTGSGKTIAYAVPVVQYLQEIRPKIKRSDGVFALIVVPTRELALQCFETFSTLTKAFTWIVPGYLIGGEKKKSEKARLRRGLNILICTPGRLLDHLDHTACLALDKIQWLVIDEADKLLEQGFEESVTKIVVKCQKERHTVLLSATLSKAVENLAGMSLLNPVQIHISSDNDPEHFHDLVLPSSLKQFIIIVPSKLRLAVISAFIIDNCLKGGFKGVIFMCSQSTVDFHHALFSSILALLLNQKEHKCKFFRLHGNMKQEERTEIFNAFKSVKEGVLLSTDVAARGLDLPHIDWIVQYSAPMSAEIYVHRVGRTARIGKKGSALLFLLPSENKFSHLLAEHKIQFEEVAASKLLQSLLLIGDILLLKTKVSAEDCATALQTRYEKEVYSEELLHQIAKEAFASYVQSYASYPKQIRHILPFKALHLGHVAKSFCLREAPSELGVAFPNSRRPTNHNFYRDNSALRYNSKPFDKKSVKRKHQVISEFDSGLSKLPHDMGRKKKKH